MKETITITRDHGDSGGRQKTAAQQGQRGDTQLAHVNPWEQALLKALGGAGTRNPQTGLRQFYNTNYQDYLSYFGSPQAYAEEIQKKTAAGTPLQDIGAATSFRSENPSYFSDQPWTSVLSSTGMTPEQYAALIQQKTSQGTTLTNPYAATAFQQQNPQYFDTATANYDFPTNIMPTSGSNTQSYSGLPSAYQSSLLQALMPQLQSAITNMPGNIDEYTNQATQGYQKFLNDALKTNIPKAISGLANRGIINSTEGQNVLAQVNKDALTAAGDKQYASAMQAALLKANMPNVLGDIAKLGTSTASTGTSYSQDPTAMYSIIASLLKGMM